MPKDSSANYKSEFDKLEEDGPYNATLLRVEAFRDTGYMRDDLEVKLNFVFATDEIGATTNKPIEVSRLTSRSLGKRKNGPEANAAQILRAAAGGPAGDLDVDWVIPGVEEWDDLPVVPVKGGDPNERVRLEKLIVNGNNIIGNTLVLTVQAVDPESGEVLDWAKITGYSKARKKRTAVPT